MIFANEVFQPTGRIIEDAKLVVEYRIFLSNMASAVDVKSFGAWIDPTRLDKADLREHFMSRLAEAINGDDFIGAANWAMLLDTIR